MIHAAMSFVNDENGLVISAELVIVLTVGVLAMIVGLNGVAAAVSGELNDLSSAFGTIDQSFFYRGLRKSTHAAVAGSGFADTQDFCDCAAIWTTGASMQAGHYHGGNNATYAAPPPVHGPELVDPCPDGSCPDAPAAGCDPCQPTDTPLKPLEETAPIPSTPADPVAPPQQ